MRVRNVICTPSAGPHLFGGYYSPMSRGKSLFKLRKARLRINSRGVSVTPPSMRIGDSDSYVTVGKRGVSYTKRTRFGSFNSRNGCSVPIGLFLCAVFAMAMFLARAVA